MKTLSLCIAAIAALGLPSFAEACKFCEDTSTEDLRETYEYFMGVTNFLEMRSELERSTLLLHSHLPKSVYKKPTALKCSSVEFLLKDERYVWMRDRRQSVAQTIPEFTCYMRVYKSEKDGQKLVFWSEDSGDETRMYFPLDSRWVLPQAGSGPNSYYIPRKGWGGEILIEILDQSAREYMAPATPDAPAGYGPIGYIRCVFEK